ncbi:hypothetical protein ACWFMI_05310 [Nocardiopsis terrae]
MARDRRTENVLTWGGADAAEFGELSPTALRMGVVVCAVALGLLLMLTAVRRPLLLPRTRSLPSFAAGALAVVLTGVALPVLARSADGSGMLHVVAGDLPEAAPVPDRVREAGWEWEPDRGGRVQRIMRGSHGPLVALNNGVVSLDGTNGTEVWSYRRPSAEEVSVWGGNGQVLVTHTPEDPGSDKGDTDQGRLTEVLDLVTGELVAEYTVNPREAPDGVTGALVGWSDGVRVHFDRRERGEWNEPIGVGAWDGESGEELWYRRLAPEEGRVCGGGAPRVRADMVVYALVCVSEDDYAASDHTLGTLVLLGNVHTEFRIVAVDLRTGEERWSDERDGWEEAFVPDRPWTAQGEGDRGDVLVVLSGWTGVPGLLLDPDTGEEILHLTEDLLEEEDLSVGQVLDVDGSGVTLSFSKSYKGTEVHHVDLSGDRTELVGAGGAHTGAFPEAPSAVLAEQTLFSDPAYVEQGDQAQILVASHGERLGSGLHNRIALGKRGVGGVGQLTAVPGGVAVLMETSGSNTRVEGLVP